MHRKLKAALAVAALSLSVVFSPAVAEADPGGPPHLHACRLIATGSARFVNDTTQCLPILETAVTWQVGTGSVPHLARSVQTGIGPLVSVPDASTLVVSTATVTCSGLGIILLQNVIPYVVDQTGAPLSYYSLQAGSVTLNGAGNQMTVTVSRIPDVPPFSVVPAGTQFKAQISAVCIDIVS